MWAQASWNCINKNVGGRKAWRLPSIAELVSLVDQTQNSPALPTNHPFTRLQEIYWSATTLQGLLPSREAYTLIQALRPPSISPVLSPPGA
jgi:uncharacterized protein DUF1566